MVQPCHLIARNLQKIKASVHIKVLFVDPEDVCAIFFGYANVLRCLAKAEAVAG
jgi:hypothetical protein